MRRVVVLSLLALCCFVTATAAFDVGGMLQHIIVAADGSHRPIDAFDSRRRPGQLIVYTPDYGSATATVDAVVEMIVADDHVVEVRRYGYNNTPIPARGYVVSGHGASGDWLRLNFRPGDPVEIRRYEVMGDAHVATHPIHAVGPRVSRGADQLVIFTPGGARTGTNPWGLEAVVREDVVVSVGGNDSPIPFDGYVVSAHGSAKDWLTANVRVGSVARIDEDTLTVTYDSRSLLFQAQTYLAEAQTNVAVAAAEGIPLPLADIKHRQAEAQRLLHQAYLLHEQGAENKALQVAAHGLEQAHAVAMATLPSHPVGVRGVWYRHVELTPDHVIATLDRLVNTGINTVFLEVFYQGRTLYPSDIALQHPDFRRWDPLAVWAEEAKRRDIDLHLWVHVFRFGEYPTGPILSRNPQWMASGPQTDVPSSLQANRYSVDPAHPAARAYVLTVLEEMITRYDVAGLHLDYIRYPKREADLGLPSVTDFSRRIFKEETGIDPLQWVNRTDSEQWQRWQVWQEEQITSFVAAVHDMVNRVRPNIVLSASVIGELGEARFVTRQNWARWADAGYVSLLVPMVYNPDSAWVGRAMEAARERVGGKVLLTAGLGVYLGFTPQIVVDQVQTSHHNGSWGASFYALSSLDGAHFAALTPGLYRRPAVPPYRTAEALRALGLDLALSLEQTGTAGELGKTASMLQAYGTDAGVSLHDLGEALDRVQRSAHQATPWQMELVGQAQDLVAVALYRALPAAE